MLRIPDDLHGKQVGFLVVNKAFCSPQCMAGTILDPFIEKKKRTLTKKKGKEKNFPGGLAVKGSRVVNCCGSGACGGERLIPGLGPSTCYGCGQKKNNARCFTKKAIDHNIKFHFSSLPRKLKENQHV